MSAAFNAALLFDVTSRQQYDIERKCNTIQYDTQVGNQVFEQARRLLDAEGRGDDAVAIQVRVRVCVRACASFAREGRRVSPSGRRRTLRPPPLVFDDS